MKIFYFGTVCNLSNYEIMMKKSKAKTTVAGVVFESALLSGFSKLGVEMDIYTYPMFPTFPTFPKIFFGKKVEDLDFGYKCTWLRTCNLPVIKQIVRRIDGRRALKKWLKHNQGQDCAVLTFAIPPFLAKDIIKLSRKYNVKCFAIITDLLRDMYMNETHSRFISNLKQLYLHQAIRYQGKYDAYVYLTKEMSEVINPEKPFIVVEGVADVSNAKAPDIKEKITPAAIMYAGMLHKKYGILNLVEAFCKLNKNDAELWLFGDGSCVQEIKEYCSSNDRIKYFGNTAREKVLEYERKATLLVNVRDPKDSFTKYSFPSKTIEYMLSGTPMLTTKLTGIPEEYFEYLFLLSDVSVEVIAAKLEEILGKTQMELCEFGKRAQEFIIQNKKSSDVGRKIIKFIETQNSISE